MTTDSSPPKATRDHIGKSLRLRLQIFSLVFLGMCAVLIFDVVQRHFNPILIVIGVAVGTLMGIVLSRMSHLQWNEDSHQVVARMDAIGGGILLLYLVFVFNRDQWLGYWVRGNDLAALTLSLTAGTMLGRVIGTVRGIRAVLVAWGFSVGRDA